MGKFKRSARIELVFEENGKPGEESVSDAQKISRATSVIKNEPAPSAGLATTFPRF